MRATYRDSGEAKCTFMGLKLKGKAARWYLKLDEAVTSSFDRFSAGLLERFPAKDNSGSAMQNAMKSLFELKQKGRTYDALFEEADGIARDLPSGMEAEVASRLIKALEDETLSKVAGGILAKLLQRTKHCPRHKLSFEHVPTRTQRTTENYSRRPKNWIRNRRRW